jgi:non-ribosomal peptide synthetase component F
MFVNMLAMRNRPRGEKTFSEFLHQVKINALDAYENQDYPFIELVKKLNVPGKSNRSPLLNAVFTIQNFNLETQETDKPGPVHNLKITPYGYNRKVSLFDLNLVVLEARGGIRMILEYSTQLFEKSTIREIAKHYLEILNQVIQDPGIKIKEVKVTSQLVTLKPKQIIDDSDFGF